MHTTKNLTLLMIEDNPGDAALIQELATEVIPVELIHVDRLAAGRAHLASTAVDLILLDLSLPDSQGLDTFFTAQAQAPHIPIIVLTGLDDETTALEALKAGAQDYLIKGRLDARDLGRAIRYAIERGRAHQNLTTVLLEKDVLLKETHHRVKNNLQIISSLLNLQAESLADPQVRERFLESQRRIRAMALVHEQLYQSTDLAHIEAARYVQLLVNYLMRAFQSATPAVRVRFAIDKIVLDIDRAIPLGLIINELVSNSLKHAFPNNQAGEIWVALHSDASGILTLTVGDTGIGMPPDLDVMQVDSLGLELVRALAQQLHGDLRWERGTGTIVALTIPALLAGDT
jgi:two-component sensor histidine kinase